MPHAYALKIAHFFRCYWFVILVPLCAIIVGFLSSIQVHMNTVNSHLGNITNTLSALEAPLYQPGALWLALRALLQLNVDGKDANAACQERQVAAKAMMSLDVLRSAIIW
jgi:hypothetical protein